ncbi:hypothetical protein Pst134EA_017828 [Puccinia striiformis f. sp. tritici]|uniref:uncharacterized protein n=1 Tax=Puccinia striiformis f. sp. tritici TaxID=168172 RepID=UPI002007D7AB|nr:uncharacterized protein Pst134EA_031715 [Puccinia striiformis f. sp. tritici]XP_047804474.1 hypothetical protein Pst134EA_017828 [Puccinia striiformis f. sp. tritici]KAH9445184.1 hypothetical protein Pst134EA_031715 [Puccinia striiformis f. sp. tritici]KAH9461527.1 hypothetical protein Pst134EA_017828 [Puccinia striiformis f. sp. tritici]
MSDLSSHLKVLLLLLITVKFLTLLIKYRKRGVGTSKRQDVYDDLPGWPLLGLLPEVILNSRNLLEWAAQKTLVHGVGYSVTMPGMRLIEITRPDWIEHVQKTNFQNYVKGSLFQEVMSDVFGNGIFVTDGAAWKTSRQTTARIFNTNNFNNIITPAVHKTLASFMDVLSFHCETHNPVEMDDLLHRFTLESFVKMTFSQDMGSLKAGLLLSEQTEQPFAESFDYVQKQLDLQFILTAIWIRLGRLVGNRPKMVAARRTLENYAYTLIDSRTANPNKDTEVYHDLLGLFMSFTDEKGLSMSRSELKDSALNLIIAGRDTTAQALSWTFFHLVRNPDVVEKMRIEIDKLTTSNDELVDYSNYKHFTYHLAVFYEALRLHPSVPKNAKFAVNHDKIPNGPLVQPGDLLRWSDWQMARDPSIWGPDCTEFKPSRWIDESGNLRQFGQWKFHAFNGGPRICIGMHLATLEAIACLVQVVRTFDLEFEPGWFENVPKIRKISPDSTEQTPRYASSLTLPMANPLRIVVRKRNSQ